MDADSYPADNLEILFGNIEQEGFDLCSVRVIPNPKQEQTYMWKLQNIEYMIAMDNRIVFKHLTSGAALVGKTNIFKEIYKHHTLFQNGEDIEHGIISKALNFNIGHIPFIIFTDVPQTFQSWFKQRSYWLIGAFRHNIVNIRYHLTEPWVIFYYVIIFYGLLPVRGYYTIFSWYMIPAVYLVYMNLLMVFRYKTFSPIYFLFPFYCLIQSVILPWFGIFRYFKKSLEGSNFGVIRHTKIVTKYGGY